MDYSVLFSQTLQTLGFDLHAEYNCFDTPYSVTQGWPLKLPTINFNQKTLLLLHFQDFVTPCNNTVIELQAVEKHYGQHANQVLVTYWSHGLSAHYHGPINLIEFSNHNLDTVTKISALALQWQQHMHTKTMAWQCLNGRMCQHRRRAVDILQHWPQGVLSYGTEIALPQWPYSTYKGTENHDNFLRLLPIYSQCAVNIVTETQYDQRPGIVTEKTLMALIAGQIPIVIGHPGIVQDCRELGFDMFDDLVDTSYDWLPNDQRVEQAILRNKELILGTVPLHAVRDRLHKNQQFVLQQLPSVMVQRFKQDCNNLRALQISKKLF